MKKRFVLIGVLLATAAGIGWHEMHPEQTGGLVLYGDVDIREVDMAFRQSGRMNRLLVDEGDRVHGGQLLATLDDEPFREALAAATAGVAQARAQLDELKHGNRPQQIAQAREAVRQALAADVNAHAELARQQALLPGGTTSQHAVDAARAASDAADAALAAARQQHNLMQVGSREEDIAAGKARLAAAEATQAQAGTALADTRLIAPADAIVFSRVREAGSMVSPSAPVLTLSLATPVYVRAYVPETALGRVVPGTPVDVTTDSSSRHYRGSIGFVSPIAEFTPKTVETATLRTDLVYRVRITIDHPDDALRQGMPVTIRVADTRKAS